MIKTFLASPIKKAFPRNKSAGTQKTNPGASRDHRGAVAVNPNQESNRNASQRSSSGHRCAERVT